MTIEKNSSEQKSKTRKSREVKASPPEEIVVKLASHQAELEQVQGEQKGLADGPDQLQQKLDDLKSMNQATENEIEALKKHLQTAEESAAVKFEAMQRAQQESERQRLHMEGKIQDLEKIMTALAEKQRIEAEKQRIEKSTAPSVVLASSAVEMKKTTGQQVVAAKAPTPKPFVTPEQVAKTVESIDAQVSTTAFAINGGFTAQSTIRLSGKDALPLVRNQVPFQITWYAHKLTGGGSILLKTSHANLIANKLEYTIKADLPRLIAGPYRLTTVVTFPTGGNLATYYQGPVIQAT